MEGIGEDEMRDTDEDCFPVSCIMCIRQKF